MRKLILIVVTLCLLTSCSTTKYDRCPKVYLPKNTYSTGKSKYF